ncbi:MAG: peptidylprolyl isomerase [Ignavibacteriota bacterium]|nr:MAG: peptidylprolyl isomerase [Ignavibacteriota bacterium]GIK21328.1 MAG: peptidyl-prolyl cis-trans isomerase [Ignavibacteriota bacterium]
MPIEVNKVVTLNFTLTDDTGNVLDSTNQGGPFSYITGRGMVLPKLEEAISIMMIGTKKQLRLDAADAYGNYNEQIVQVVGKENFPKDFVLEVGMEYMASNPEGVQMPFTIIEVNDDEITIDFNHPFAGINLNFDLELLDVRDATAEELAHGHVHGPGGHHHH